MNSRNRALGELPDKRRSDCTWLSAHSADLADIALTRRCIVLQAEQMTYRLRKNLTRPMGNEFVDPLNWKFRFSKFDAFTFTIAEDLAVQML